MKLHVSIIKGEVCVYVCVRGWSLFYIFPLLLKLKLKHMFVTTVKPDHIWGL